MSTAQYRLTGRLESGALADLYEATRDGQPVMVKLFQELSSDLGYARRIAETARVLVGVQHPGIVHEVELGVVRRRLAVVRPSVEGFTLGSALQKLNTRDVVLPSTIALGWAIELLETVQKAHDAGVVHGGITPGNVILGPTGQTCLCDFGAMGALLATPALKKSMLGSGRSGYRAPEVHRGEMPTEVADIYSIGALLYELLTLREPGGGRDDGATRVVAMHTRREQVTPPSRIDRRLNARLDPIVMRALEAVPTRRFRSAAEFAGALRNFLAESGGLTSAEDLARCVGELATRRPTSADVPFTAPFTLTAIEGGELGGAGERTMVFDERPAYSGGRVKPDEFPEDAPTTEAPPAFEEYRPEPTALARPSQPPRFDDTDPGQAGPLEKGWEAPPGEAPRKKVNDRGERSVVRPPRVKVIEDFSVIEPAPELSSISRSGRRREPREASSGREVSPLRGTVPGRGAPRGNESSGAGYGASSSWANPRDTAPNGGTGMQRPLRTAERRMLLAMKRNQRFLLIISGLALMGALCFGAAIWQLHQQRNRALREGPPPRPLVHRPVAIPIPAVPKPHPAPAVHAASASRPEPIRWDEPPSRRHAGYLTVHTNVPAYVFIDGARVRSHTPLRRYRVRPGRRKIVVEAIATGDKRDFTVSIVRGKLRVVYGTDLKGAPR